MPLLLEPRTGVDRTSSHNSTLHTAQACTLRCELLEPLLAASSLDGAGRVLARCREIADGRGAPFLPGGPPFVADPPEAKAVAAALAARPHLPAEEAVAVAREEARAAGARKRAAWEARMQRRAAAGRVFGEGGVACLTRGLLL